jgi:hypothetical protein
MGTLRRLARLGVAALSFGASAGAAFSAARCPEVGFTIVERKASPETRLVKFRKSRTLHVRRNALTGTADIVEAKLGGFGDEALQLRFRPEAAARLEAATTDHDGLRLAFVVDDEALMAVTWSGPYGMDRSGTQVDFNNPARTRSLLESLKGCIGAR